MTAVQQMKHDSPQALYGKSKNWELERKETEGAVANGWKSGGA